MRQLQILILVIVVGAMSTGCASLQSTPPMVPQIERAPRWECTVRCPEPPTLMTPRETWELLILDWGLACKRLHDDCVGNTRKP